MTCTITVDSEMVAPGQTVRGTVSVVPDQNTPLDIESVDVALMAPNGATELTFCLAESVVLAKSLVLPLHVVIPYHYGATGADGPWMITVAVRSTEPTVESSATIHVRTPRSRSVGEAFSALLFALPILAVGLLALYGACMHEAAHRLPIGIQWFAGCVGIACLAIIRSLVGRIGDRGPLRFAALPFAVIVLGVGLWALVLAAIDPFATLTPFNVDWSERGLGSLSGLFADTTTATAQLIAFLSAGVLLPIAASMVPRWTIASGPLAELALLTTATTMGIAYGASLIDALIATSHLPPLESSGCLFLVLAAVAIVEMIRRPSWTSMPAPVVVAAAVPSVVLCGATAPYQPLAGGIVGVWTLWMVYTALRAAIAGLTSVHVSVDGLQPVRIGRGTAVRVNITPRHGCLVTDVRSVLLCERTHVRMVGTDRSYDTVTEHREELRLPYAEGSLPGHVIISHIIPGGRPASEESGTQWSMTITVRCAGRSDWARTFPLTVVP